MIILGITHPISWNNAACILVDGELKAMVEEERLNRIKHSPRMAPVLAMQYCLDNIGCTVNDIDYLAIGFDSAYQLALQNIKSKEISHGLNQAAQWYRQGTQYEKMLPIKDIPKRKIIFVNHHRAHLASSFYASGFTNANIISLDGSGGTESGCLAIGNGNTISILKTISNQGSWGLIYEQITEKLGFRRHSGEGKVMGLAAYGKPDKNGLPFVHWDKDIPYISVNERKDFINNLPIRAKDDPIEKFHENLAATLQYTLEKAVSCMAEWLYKQTGYTSLCMAGGTALNCSMNGVLAQLPFVSDIFIQPAAYDAGTALGAALEVHVQKTGNRPDWTMIHAYWGPEFTNDEIANALNGYEELRVHKSKNIYRDTARLLAEGKIIGWFQGRSEIGPRALGNRSIIADPSIPGMKDKINNYVKHREPWRPFAPSILEEKIDQYVDAPRPSPFMIMAFNTKETKRKEIISATHIDGTIRPQTVSKETNKRYWELINEFYKITRIPVILNTSFNVDSQPIVNAPKEAIDTFLNCGIDILSIGDYLVYKE
jgi:carbamoyltransferase